MTTEDKLKALGFEKGFSERTFYKYYSDGTFNIFISFNSKNEIGFIKNVIAEYCNQIYNFKELLKWDNFYEKQAKRIARRNESRNGGETQNQFHQAH